VLASAVALARSRKNKFGCSAKSNNSSLYHVCVPQDTIFVLSSKCGSRTTLARSIVSIFLFLPVSAYPRSPVPFRRERQYSSSAGFFFHDTHTLPLLHQHSPYGLPLPSWPRRELTLLIVDHLLEKILSPELIVSGVSRNSLGIAAGNAATAAVSTPRLLLSGLQTPASVPFAGSGRSPPCCD